MLRNPSLLSLTSIELQRLLVQANERYDVDAPQEAPADFKFGAGVHEKDPHQFRAELQVQFPSAHSLTANLPYTVEGHIVGYFWAPIPLEQDRFDGAVLANALLILYGSLRGHLSGVTGAAAHGTWVLPTVNFRDLLEKQAPLVDTPSKVADAPPRGKSAKLRRPRRTTRKSGG